MKINILNLIDFDEVNKLLEGFNQSTGFVTAILDLDGNVLSNSGWRQICTEFHRINPETSKKCKISDTTLACNLCDGEKYHFYECLNGLVDVVVPIVINGEHIANLFSGQFFFNKPDRTFYKEQAGKYGFNEQKYLSALEDVPIISKEKVKVAMDFLLNMTQLISEITFQKMGQLQLNEDLRKSEEKYRLISDNSDDWIYWIAPDGHLNYVSPACERVTGYSPEEFTDHPELNHEIIYEADQEKFSQHTQISILDDTPHNLEFRILTKKGEIRWISHSCSPILNNEGEYLGRRTTNRNISERKRQEERLFESEFRYSNLYENGPFGMVMADKEFRFKKANPVFCTIMGYSEAELQKFSFKEVSHPDDLKNDLPYFQKLINKEISVYKTEKRFIRKDGQVIWGSLTLTATYDNEGQFLYNLGIIEDITRRKLAEEELEKSVNDFRLLAESMPQIVWITRPDGWNIYFNQQWVQYKGLTLEESYGHGWNQPFHPEDQQRAWEAWENSIKNNDVYSLECRLRRYDGSYRWWLIRGIPIFDSNNIIIKWFGTCTDIHELKQTEIALQESKLKLDSALSSMTDAVFISDKEGRFIDFNEAFATFHRFKNKEECAKTFVEYPEFLEVYLSTGELATIEQWAIPRALNGEIVKNAEYKLRRIDTGETWIGSYSFSPIRDSNGTITGSVVTARDITEIKLVEEKVRKKDLEFRKLSANVPDLIFQFTRRPDGTYYVPIATEGIRNIYGCSPEDVLNDFGPIGSVIHPDDLARVMNEIEYSAKNLSNFACEYRVQLPGQEIKWLLSKSTPEKLPDGSITWYGFNSDISLQKQAEDKIRKLNETLEQRVEERTTQLQVANRELEAFSYSVSHDLRAPLRHINGYVSLLSGRYQDNLPDKARHYLATITKAAKQMGKLIDDLLQFSRTGRQEIHKAKLDMNVLVKEVLEQIKPDMENRDIKWSLKEMPEVFGDYSLLKQVWINLLDNAVKYTKFKKPAEITIDYTDVKDNFVFSVHDNGVGFDMKYAQKLFGVFQRLHLQSEFEGTGIGLANVQRIIHKHNGNVWAEAEPNKGATFSFTLPKNKEDIL